MAYKTSRYAVEGSEQTETGITRVGGQAASRRIDVTTVADWPRPFTAEPYVVWNNIVGTDRTLTVYGTQLGTGVAPPKNDEVWFETNYPIDANSALGKVVTTTKANIYATSTSNSTDASTWNIPPTAFDTKISNVVVSNQGLTLLHNNTLGSAGAACSYYCTAGKYYWEYYIQVSTGLFGGVGLLAAEGNITERNIPGPNIFSVYTGNSSILFTYYNTGLDLGTMAVGSVWQFAVDLTARLGWVKHNASNWNATVGADPATGVGGVPIQPGKVFAPFFIFNSTSTTTDQVTINFGTSAYVYAKPTGFNNWCGVSPFKIVSTLSSPQPARAGYIDARVRVGKPSTLYYIDPAVEISGSGGTVSTTTADDTSRYAQEGTELTERAFTRAGSSPNLVGQKQTRKLFTTQNCAWQRPFKAQHFAMWNTTVGVPVTVTIYGVTTGIGTVVNNDDIWMEVEYLGSATSAQGTLATTTKANYLATPTAYPSDASTWTTFPYLLYDGPQVTGNITLTPDKLTAGHTVAVNNNAVTCSAWYSTGKYYWEGSPAFTSAGTTSGLTSSYTDLGTPVSSTDVWGVNPAGPSNTWIYNNSSITVVNLGPTAQMPARSIYSYAVDLGGKVGWIRRDGGNWNANASANPTTGVGGIAIDTAYPNASYTPYVRFTTNTVETFTSNFGQSAFAYAVPSGFTAFNGPTPFKMTKTITPNQVGYIHVRVRIGKAGATFYIDPTIELT